MVMDNTTTRSRDCETIVDTVPLSRDDEISIVLGNEKQPGSVFAVMADRRGTATGSGLHSNGF